MDAGDRLASYVERQEHAAVRHTPEARTAERSGRLTETAIYRWDAAEKGSHYGVDHDVFEAAVRKPAFTARLLRRHLGLQLLGPVQHDPDLRRLGLP